MYRKSYNSSSKIKKSIMSKVRKSKYVVQSCRNCKKACEDQNVDFVKTVSRSRQWFYRGHNLTGG